MIDLSPESEPILDSGLVDCLAAHSGIRTVILASPGNEISGVRRQLPHARVIQKPVLPSNIGEILRPAPEVADISEHVPELPDLRCSSGSTTGSILVVEDDVTNRTLALRLLQAAGYEVHAAENGSEAVKESMRRRHDLILMDVQLPDMDGLEATRQIRLQEELSGQPPVPIVALTAHDTQDYQHLAFACGMDDCITKPIRGDGLRSVVRKWISTGAQTAAGPMRQADHTEPQAGEAADSQVIIIPPDCADLILAYLENVRQDCTKLRRQLSSGDFKAIRETAHNLKGSGGAYGFTEISVIAGMLQEAANRRSGDDIAGLISRLRRYLANVRWQPSV